MIFVSAFVGYIKNLKKERLHLPEIILSKLNIFASLARIYPFIMKVNAEVMKFKIRLCTNDFVFIRNLLSGFCNSKIANKQTSKSHKRITKRNKFSIFQGNLQNVELCTYAVRL